MTKKVWGVIVVVVIIIVVAITLAGGNKSNGALRIGILLPLSGTAAQYGEQIRNGAEIAKNELKAKGIDLEIIYEDNKADPTTAISAYRKFVDLDKVDYIVSAMTRATIPLIDLVRQDKTPMFMTLVAGDWDRTKTDRVIRFYPTARQYVRSNDEDKVLNGLSSVGVLYVNDEYGNSVYKEIQNFAIERGFEVKIAESYLPSNQDYRLNLSKMKNVGVDLIMMVSSSPVELSAISKQYKELGISQKLFDASVGLSNPNVRLNNKDALEGVITRATRAELANKDVSAETFFAKYDGLYNSEPYFPAIFGYESINLINGINGQKGSDFIEKISKLRSFSTIMGDLKIDNYQEINPPIYNAVIKDGQLVEF